jgi:hypothetical protein
MRVCALALALWLSACGRSPPPSRFPSAQAALERMRATGACGRGLKGEAKLTYFGDGGRVRGSVLYLTELPDRVRFDVVSPFGATLSTLTADGRNFALYDLREKQFLHGPANACNLARFTRVPIPPHALVQLLRGEAPVLVHSPDSATIDWKSGRYVVRIPSKHQAEEEIQLEPVDEDFGLDWRMQRVRVLGVRVVQAGVVLYRAELAGHRARRTSAPLIDPDGIDPPILPSGPECSAEVPSRIRLEVPGSEQELILSNVEVVHNPPLAPGVFEQRPPGGVVVRYSPCDRER